LELYEVLLMMNCCCFVSINSLHELLRIIIECEISPFCLNVASTLVTCRYPGVTNDVS